MTFSSLVNCWLHVVFFRPVAWKAETLMWFALSPYLESRATGRKPSSASENWKTLRAALRSSFGGQRDAGATSSTNKVFPVQFHIFDVKNAQATLHEAEVDVTFESMIIKGRKFASGIFSVLVLFFVGSLTASIGALICEPRDDTIYLVQDPTVECDYSSSRYRTMVAVAVTALVLRQA